VTRARRRVIRSTRRNSSRKGSLICSSAKASFDKGAENGESGPVRAGSQPNRPVPHSLGERGRRRLYPAGQARNDNHLISRVRTSSLATHLLRRAGNTLRESPSSYCTARGKSLFSSLVDGWVRMQ
jgi:hypothetical protein